MIFFTCTEKGVEWSLIGTWEIVDYDRDNATTNIDDAGGTLIIRNNDTYDADLTLKFESGVKREFDDYGTLKACSVNKYLQFFSKDDDADQYKLMGIDNKANTRYTIDGDNLTIYNDDRELKLKRISYSY